MRRALLLAVTILVVLYPAGFLYAQIVPKGPALRLQVVFERHEKDKKVSSVPYTVSLVATSANEPLQMIRVRMGVQVPMHFEAIGPDKPSTPSNVVYKEVGDALDCSASLREDGRFLVRCNFEQSSVASSGESGAGSSPGSRATQALTPPLIHTFRSEAALVLADGQTARHSAGTDRLTGETVSVDVTLTVIK